MLLVKVKSTHGANLSQALQIKERNSKKLFFLWLTITVSSMLKTNIKFCFENSNTDEDGFIQITLPPSSFESESFNDKIKRLIFEEELFTEADYPFTVKTEFSTLRSIIEFFQTRTNN